MEISRRTLNINIVSLWPDKTIMNNVVIFNTECSVESRFDN